MPMETGVNEMKDQLSRDNRAIKKYTETTLSLLDAIDFKRHRNPTIQLDNS